MGYKSGYSKRPLKDAFEASFIKGDKSECWLWTGPTFKLRGGYGCFTHRPSGMQMKRAHRISYALYRSKIDEDQHVLHRCDNPRCVNPHHLFLGDQPSNMKDKAMKCRQLQGDKHPLYRHGKYIGQKKNPKYPSPS